MNYSVTDAQLTAIADAIRERDIREDIRDNEGYAEIDTSKGYLYSCIIPSVLRDQMYEFTIHYYDSSKTQITTQMGVVYDPNNSHQYFRNYTKLKPANGYPEGTKYIKVTPPNNTIVAENICEMVSYEFPNGFLTGIRS